jgi:hypothetical protein
MFAGPAAIGEIDAELPGKGQRDNRGGSLQKKRLTADTVSLLLKNRRD